MKKKCEHLSNEASRQDLAKETQSIHTPAKGGNSYQVLPFLISDQ